MTLLSIQDLRVAFRMGKVNGVLQRAEAVKDFLIGKGIDAGSAHGFPLRPAAEYRHPLGMLARASSGPLDLGAHQHTQ